MTSQIAIYKAKDGHIELEISISNGTLWLSQQQIADLFGTKRQAISKHLKNIFISKELDEDSVCSILEHTASDGKKYKTKFYNLDAIISVGYRVNSNQATQFRIWATNVVKDHLIQGYTLYEKNLAQKGIKDLEQSIDLLQKTLVKNELVNELGSNTIQLIISYAKTWELLLAYDEDRLMLPKEGRETIVSMEYSMVVEAIQSLKTRLAAKNEASALFGNERDKGFESILNNIE